MRNVKNKANRTTIGRVRKGLASCLLVSAAVVGLIATNQAVEQTCTPPPPNMVSWWPGDGYSSDLLGTNHGTLHNGATFGAGKVGPGFSLDGVDDYIRVPDNPNLYPDAGSFTVEAWVKTPQTGHYEMIMQHYECGGSSCAYSVYQLYITPDGKLVGFLRDESTNSEDLQSTTIVADNVFHHVAMVRDTTNGQFLLFVDGVQAASAPLTVVGTIKNADGEADPVTIGEGFSGIIDEVEYFNRALSSSEIQAIYDAGSAGKCKPQFTCTPPPPSMVSWWPGDGNAKDIQDGNNGTLQNGATFAAGLVDRAFLLDGIDDFVNVGNAANLHVSSGEFTVQAWVKFNALSHPPGANPAGIPPGDMSIVDKGASSGASDGWRLLKQDDNRFYFCFMDQCGNGTFMIRSQTRALTGAYYHVSVVKSSTTFSMYVNGILEDTRTLPFFIDSNSGDLLIGASPTTEAHLNGLIDEVQMFNRALSASEIRAIVNADSLGQCKQAPNSAPVANTQSVTTTEDNAKAITLSSSDADGDTLTYTITSNPSHGSLSGTAPNVTYTPNADYNGSDSFAFKVNDGQTDSAKATVSITVSPVNDAPVANPQSVTTNEDTAKAITLTASDPEGDTLTYIVTGDPAHGALSGTAPHLTYTPSANYSGNDSFNFKVNDGTTSSGETSVLIMVSPVNDAPVANSQSIVTNEDTAKAISLSASDIDGDALTYDIVTGPSHGALTGTAPNVTYAPASNYNGEDSFTFKVNDGTVDSVAAIVSITVSPVNDPPIADGQSITTNEDTAKPITLSGSDVDGDALTYIVTSSPSHGTLSGTAPNVTYAPAANYNGSDAFTFKLNDGSVDSAAAIVSITVSPVNDAPAADSQSATTNEDTAKAITLSGSDVDGDPLSYSVTTNPSHGALSGTAPNLTYAPNSNYNGPDSFTFKVNDGTTNSGVATVSITVRSVNDAPVADSQSITTRQDTTNAITLSGSDVDGNALTYAITGSPSHGALTGAPPNVTYTPATNYNGSDSFTFSVNDGTVNSASATVSITVNLHYTFGGFLQPIDTGIVNSANAGQTIPVKWRLTDGNGMPISDPSSFVGVTSFATPGGCGGSADAIETYAASTATGLQYLGDGNWQFNWKTPKSYAGQCRTMSLNLKDGELTRTAAFIFR